MTTPPPDATEPRTTWFEQFSLRADTDYKGTVERLRAGIEFRGANLWTLVLAIVIASVGLNVNSTAVIIGAMLISPLMGPITGIGAGLAMEQLGLVARSLRNLGVAAAASVAVSAAYFALSPLAEVQSELLARTRPTIYDVLIAVAGGLAGAVASTRSGERSTAIPGVAIATALMPPLCTAGFGLATRNLGFFIGALYLFAINSIFIALATFVMLRFLRFPRAAAQDDARRRRLRLAIAAITTLTVLPSLVVAWQVVQETRFQARARRFLAERLESPDRALLGTELRYARDSSTIAATLVGPVLSADSLDVLEALLPEYGLSRARLRLRQPTARESLARATLEATARQALSALQEREARIRELESRRASPEALALLAEVQALVPSVERLAVGEEAAAGQVRPVVLVEWKGRIASEPAAQLDRFLQQRLRRDSLLVRHVPAR